MGDEVSGYIDRLVPALQSAYGVAWNIEARGESPTIDDRAWQVYVGYSNFMPQRNGAQGLPGEASAKALAAAASTSMVMFAVPTMLTPLV